MNQEDWQLTTVANHDPRLMLVSGSRDDADGKLYTEELPITGWLMITKIEGWGTTSEPITLGELVHESESIVFNTETEAWYELHGNQRCGKGRDDMMSYLQELTKGLVAVK